MFIDRFRMFIVAMLTVMVVAVAMPGDAQAQASPYNYPGIMISYALSNAGLTEAHPQGQLMRPSSFAWVNPDVQRYVSRYMQINGYTPTAMVLASNFLSGSGMPDGTCVPRLPYEPVLPPSGWLLNLMVDLYVYPR